ncbi:MAG: DUF2958 domain-containing protein [Chloroflexi bacterium]|nr:DUF2958 domain-containing protein [Chloroflexota bacterium]
MSESESQLEFAQQLYADHRPKNDTAAQRMVYDYMPQWVSKAIPPLYSTDNEPDPIVWRKFFLSEGRWTFYVTEYSKVAPDGMPDLFFGYLVSPLGPDCNELCYMALSQVQELRGAGVGLPVEVDLYWRPVRLSTLKRKLDEQYMTETERILSREGEPCTIVVDSGRKVTDVITPAQLYSLFRTQVLKSKDEQESSVNDALARDCFLNGQRANDEKAIDFRRFCRVVIQHCVLGQTEPDSWCDTYRNGGDFNPTSSWLDWQPYLGGVRPEPKFKVDDVVHFGWDSDPYAECHTIWDREWREYEGSWHYKAAGKWWGEDGMIAAETEPAFTKGESVWWYANPGSMVKTGTVQYTPHHDTEKVSVSCDERSSVGGGVVIGHIKLVPIDELNKGDGPTPEARAMRDLFYDDEGNLLDVDEVDQERADELLAPFMPGQPNGPDKVFRAPVPDGKPKQLSLF